MSKDAQVMLHAKIDQLPLPVADRDRAALEYHLALATLRAGHGDARVLSVLTGVLVTTYYLLDIGIQASTPHRQVFVRAQRVLNGCDVSAVQRACWQAAAADHEALGALLSLHDRQLARAPRHSVARAVARRQAYLSQAAKAEATDAQRLVA